ncbi:MAG: type IV pilus biogenesis/stability protein PilW [Cocleimonas sp.]|nr:type IV pilus biogenesis/stability protein PilW [Cocleimonas sp.]
MKTLFPILIISISLGVVGGCSSQSKKVDRQSAANYNAQLGVKYLQAGRLKLANGKLVKALKQDPESSSVNHYYALLQQKLGDNKTADKHFKKAVKLDHKDPELLNNYGSHLCQTGHYVKAVEHFDLAAQSPFYTTPEFAYTNSGICLRKMRDHSGAEMYFRKALQKNTDFGSALFQMAKLNYDQGNFAKAQAFLLRYDEKNQPAVESLALCTKINTRLGETAKAESCTEKKFRLLSR